MARGAEGDEVGYLAGLVLVIWASEPDIEEDDGGGYAPYRGGDGGRWCQPAGLCGGDGLARDILDAVGVRVSGCCARRVKVYSGAFALSRGPPRADSRRLRLRR